MFMGFKDWDEFVIYSDKSGDKEAAKIIKICDNYETRELKVALLNVRPSEEKADIVLTTAHKSKGREWSGVMLADDFRSQPEIDPETKEKTINHAETRLFYVAATRAINRLHVPAWATAFYDKQKETDHASLPG
jgi:superfamily I DNA/RNA helicase